MNLIREKYLFKNGETRCANCGAFCQGQKGPDGRILCPSCYSKFW